MSAFQIKKSQMYIKLLNTIRVKLAVPHYYALAIKTPSYRISNFQVQQSEAQWKETLALEMGFKDRRGNH